jgi:heavy metal translocating P-type ATPase
MTCALCENDLPKFPTLDGGKAFCCAGCHAVFNILSSKQELENFHQHPLFQQALRSGLISNPSLIEQIKSKQIPLADGEFKRIHLEVKELWCPSCSEVIRLTFLQHKGIRNCVVDFATDLASIEFAPRYISEQQIEAVFSSLGYQAQSLENAGKSSVSFDLYVRFIVALFCSLNVMMFAYPIYATYFDYDGEGYGALFAWLSCVFSLPVIGYSAAPIFRRFWNSFWLGIVGMEMLVMMGVSSAFFLSCYELLKGRTVVYFDSMTVVILFVLLGKIIEAKAKFSAKDSILRLTRSSPRRGRKRFKEGKEEFVSVKEIKPHDLLVVFSGEKIPLDGVVVEGEGSCDESLMTGESLPVFKQVGSSLLGGSILQAGKITFRVLNTAEDSALNKIIEMVERDMGHKSSYVRSADEIIRGFIPFVVTLAFIVAVSCLLLGTSDSGKSSSETAFLRALSILLISCPCAIGIAAPLAESHLLNSLASLGVIIRNRGCLSVLGKESVFVFDKTGTLTEGNFKVLEGLQELTAVQRSLLKGLASHSNHPISVAIKQAIEEPAMVFDRIEELVGKGLRGFYEEDRYFLGSAKFMEELGIMLKPRDPSMNSVVYFAANKACLGRLILGDHLRAGVKEMIASLSPTRSVLLSGDGQEAVRSVAHACGITNFQWGQHPLQKRDYVDQLRQKGEIVCMLGDGINDSPALTAANIGISVVNATEMSIQVSDILLTTDRLQVISKMRILAKKGHKIIKQNLFWAFCYNVMGIGLAAFGMLSPIFAAFAMVISSLIVLFNSKRIK